MSYYFYFFIGVMLTWSIEKLGELFAIVYEVEQLSIFGIFDLLFY
jgi:hypothetical protein